MHLLLVGVNHRTAALEERESLAFACADARALLARLSGAVGIDEVALLSTCNRTEFYIASTDLPAAETALREAVVSAGRRDLLGDPARRYRLEDTEAATHLFRVACGLDSMVLGDVQILGQVKEAHQRARGMETSGPLLDRLFETALHAGKRSRGESGIGAGTVSISSAAVDLAIRHSGPLTGKRIVILGAGDTARLAALHVRAQDPGSIVVVNRSGERGDRLAAEVDGRSTALDRLADEIRDADIVFSATRAPGAIVSAALLAAALADRPTQPLLIFDLAVPRDVEPAAAWVPGVVLRTLDDVQTVVDARLAERLAQVPIVDRIVTDEVAKFSCWLRGLGATPTVVALRDHFERIRLEEVDRLLSQASAEERVRADRLTRALVNRLLHAPTIRLKDADPASDDGRWRLQAARELFALDAAAASPMRRHDD
jgi:glutamyl-tRNA reductase